MRKYRNILAGIVVALGQGAAAESASLNLYGMPGLIDMPTGESAPDAQLASSLGSFAGMTRNTITFQISPRLTGSFRYAVLRGCNCFGFVDYYDRSFDLHYQLMYEGNIRPAVAVGLRDMIGTGIYSGEYLAATKHVTPNLKVTGGIGWGRLGSFNSFPNPLSGLGGGFAVRPGGVGLGGVPGFNQWFRGPAAFFGGAEWRTPVKGLSVKIEYSSDAYTLETGAPGLFVRRSPINIGVDYQRGNLLRFSGYLMHGNQLGFRTTLALNPKTQINAGSGEAAPTPVLRRPRDHEPGAADAMDAGWTAQPGVQALLLKNLDKLLAKDGFMIEAVAITGSVAEIRFRNRTFDSAAQAVGRVARVMTRVMPGSVETFVLVPLENGMPVMSVTLNRRDLEDLEHDPNAAETLLARTEITAAKAVYRGDTKHPDLYPYVTWAVNPYVRFSLFDPDNPVRADVGVRAEAKIEISPGLSVEGSVRKKVVGNMDTITRLSNSVLPHVRSDFGFYDIAGDPAVENLHGDLMFKAGRNIYGRISVGYLERMYGGVSAELLFMPTNSRLAFGIEANVVQQRAFNMLFGFQPYQVVTGHVSAYWDMRNGFAAQLDVGRYLAGDTGATLTLERRFDNGWKVGAFATLTNVPFATFGEGSFDKGLLFTIPMSWSSGTPNRKVTKTAIRPLTRDGGARLEVSNRLYPLLSEYRRHRLEPTWGRFWR